MHSFGEAINKHVVGRYPTYVVVIILYPFPDVQKVQSNTFVFGGAGGFDASVIQRLAICPETKGDLLACVSPSWTCTLSKRGEDWNPPTQHTVLGRTCCDHRPC